MRYEVCFLDHRYDPSAYKEQLAKGREVLKIGQIPLLFLEGICEGLGKKFYFFQQTPDALDQVVEGTHIFAHLRNDQISLLENAHIPLHDQIFFFITSSNSNGYPSLYTNKVHGEVGKRAVFLFSRDTKRLFDPAYLKMLLQLDVDGAIALMNDPECPFN